MAFYISTYSKVLKRSRIDAEYHSHKAWDVERTLFKSDYSIYALKDICTRLTSGHTPLRHNLEQGDVEFLTVECVSPLSISHDLSKRVELRHYAGELSRVQLSKDTVVVTIKRRIAFSSPCYDIDYPAVVNQDVAVLKLKQGWTPGFVSAYLCCSLGQLLADRERTEQMNPYLPVGLLGRLIIPHIDYAKQREIDEIIIEKLRLENQAKALYTQAEQLLKKELGLDKIQFDNPIAYEASFREAINFSRIDGEYFRPRYKQLRTLVQKYQGGYESLKQCVQCISPNITPAKTPLELFHYIELSNINAQIGIVNGNSEVFGKDAPSRARRQVTAGDIIASAVVGSVDKAALISESEEGYLASTGFFHFRSDQYSPEYLLILLRSPIMTEQLIQQATGGILSAVPESNLKHIILPILPDNIQKEITDLVQKSHSCFRESRQLLEQAKRRVEELIEQGVN